MIKHLWDRLVDAKARLEPVQLDLRVVFEHESAIAKVLVSDPNFAAAARHGGIVPVLEAYLADKEVEEKWRADGKDPAKFNWAEAGGARHPYAATAEPMTDDEIMEYLVLKDTPVEVWRNDKRRNMPSYVITSTKYVPANRMHRNAWVFSPDPEAPIVVDIDAAKSMQKRNLVEYFIRSNRRLEELKPFARFDEAAGRECASLAALNPELSFDRLDRAKTLGDLEMAIPAPLLIELGVK